MPDGSSLLIRPSCISTSSHVEEGSSLRPLRHSSAATSLAGLEGDPSLTASEVELARDLELESGMDVSSSSPCARADQNATLSEPSASKYFFQACLTK